MSAPLKERLAEVLESNCWDTAHESPYWPTCPSCIENEKAILALFRDVVKEAMLERKQVRYVTETINVGDHGTSRSEHITYDEAECGWNNALDQLEASLKQAGVL